VGDRRSEGRGAEERVKGAEDVVGGVDKGKDVQWP
jgi:hypothetical protein